MYKVYSNITLECPIVTNKQTKKLTTFIDSTKYV